MLDAFRVAEPADIVMLLRREREESWQRRRQRETIADDGGEP